VMQHGDAPNARRHTGGHRAFIGVVEHNREGKTAGGVGSDPRAAWMVPSHEGGGDQRATWDRRTTRVHTDLRIKQVDPKRSAEAALIC